MGWLLFFFDFGEAEDVGPSGVRVRAERTCLVTVSSTAPRIV